MIRALLMRQLRHQRWLLLSLCIGFVLLEWLLVVVVAVIDMGPGIAFLQQFLPPAMQAFVASQLGLVSFGGMVAFGFQHPAALAGAFAFVFVVATLPAGERESGFLELLLARPLPRSRYLAAIVLLLVVGALVLPLSLVGGVALGLSQSEHPEELPWTRYVRPAAGLTTLLLAVGGYTLYFAVGSKRRGRAIALAIGLTVTLFWLQALAQLWSPLERVSWLNPFSYYDPMRAAAFGTTPPEHPTVLLGIFIVATTAAFIRFRKQDL